jgi:hypothetical protein
VTSLLRFKGERKGAISLDIDVLDRVHLDRNG